MRSSAVSDPKKMEQVCENYSKKGGKEQIHTGELRSTSKLAPFTKQKAQVKSSVTTKLILISTFLRPSNYTA